jgi:hypothetical protein
MFLIRDFTLYITRSHLTLFPIFSRPFVTVPIVLTYARHCHVLSLLAPGQSPLPIVYIGVADDTESKR